MIELRCNNGRLFGEIDPETLTIRMPCKTCSRVWAHPVYHRWSLGKILNAIGAGITDGAVHPDLGGIDAHEPDTHCA